MDAWCSVFGALPAGHVSSLRPSPFLFHSPLCVNYHCTSGVMATLRPAGSFFNKSETDRVQPTFHRGVPVRKREGEGEKKKHVTQDSPFHIIFLSACVCVRVCVCVFFFSLPPPPKMCCVWKGGGPAQASILIVHTFCTARTTSPGRRRWTESRCGC